MARLLYTKGLHEIGDGVHAYLQPDGGWGWSNSGLITSDGASMLVDTLFDLHCTREMLSSMESITGRRPIKSVINTHGDGDHCWGNQLVPADATIFATSAAIADLDGLTPAIAANMLTGDLPDEMREYLEGVFGPFQFDDIEVRKPDELIDERRTVTAGARPVEFIPVGPAHSDGDAVVHVPDARVVFTGDVIFADGTPVTWVGPISGWLSAIDRILELDADYYVPGHGPVTNGSAVADVQRYVRFIDTEARKRHAAGLSFEDAVDDIDIGEFADWRHPERIVANVDAVFRELEPVHPPRGRATLLRIMSGYAKRHGLASGGA